MICFPNAKINIGLNVVGKRPDGYHDLETVFYPIGINDCLEVIPRPKATADTFRTYGLQIDGRPEDNLVMKAVRLMRTACSFPHVEVHLVKKIPFGAGLGGGSADASFMLKLLNDLFGLRKSPEELAHLAGILGADCPFFIYNTAVFASGTGNIFSAIDLDLSGYYFVMVKPDIHVSTRDAFGGIRPQKPTQSLKELICQPIEQWKNYVRNDFETTVFAIHPQLACIKAELYEKGAVYASMSGSGSTVYGIFRGDTPIPKLSFNFQVVR